MIYFLMLSLMILSCFSSKKESVSIPVVVTIVFILPFCQRKTDHRLPAHILSEKYLFPLKVSTMGNVKLR